MSHSTIIIPGLGAYTDQEKTVQLPRGQKYLASAVEWVGMQGIFVSSEFILKECRAPLTAAQIPMLIAEIKDRSNASKEALTIKKCQSILESRDPYAQASFLAQGLGRSFNPMEIKEALLQLTQALLSEICFVLKITLEDLIRKEELVLPFIAEEIQLGVVLEGKGQPPAKGFEFPEEFNFDDESGDGIELARVKFGDSIVVGDVQYIHPEFDESEHEDGTEDNAIVPTLMGDWHVLGVTMVPDVGMEEVFTVMDEDEAQAYLIVHENYRHDFTRLIPNLVTYADLGIELGAVGLCDEKARRDEAFFEEWKSAFQENEIQVGDKGVILELGQEGIEPLYVVTNNSGKAIMFKVNGPGEK